MDEWFVPLPHRLLHLSAGPETVSYVPQVRTDWWSNTHMLQTTHQNKPFLNKPLINRVTPSHIFIDQTISEQRENVIRYLYLTRLWTIFGHSRIWLNIHQSINPQNKPFLNRDGGSIPLSIRYWIEPSLKSDEGSNISLIMCYSNIAVPLHTLWTTVTELWL